jgi:endo-1,4-beta-xylanase
MPVNNKKLLQMILYFSLLVVLTSCLKDKVQPIQELEKKVETSVGVPPEANVNPSATPQKITTLRNSAEFLVGVAVENDPLINNKPYATIAADEFSSVTPESAMKFDRIQYEENKFDFSSGDAIVNFALLHKQRVHGHTLIWQHALPYWVNNFKGDSAAWEGIFKKHIQTVVGHFRGKVTSWDVANEAIDDNTGELVNGDKYGPGSGSIWRQHLGANYIVRAFKYAHEADPNALLFYNDYANDSGGWSDKKLNRILDIIKSIKAADGVISGIGIQMHINVDTENKKISTALKQLSATGLLVHVSELDVSVNPLNKFDFLFSDLHKQQQANKYEFVAETYKINVPKAQQFGITTWEFSDAYNEATLSGKKDYRLLFDDSYNKKPAYYGFLKGVVN